MPPRWPAPGIGSGASRWFDPPAVMRKLMILGGRTAQLPVYRMARTMGLSLVGADPDPAAPALALADTVACCDLADADELVRVARREGVQGAMTFAADYPMPALARICGELNLSGPAPEAVSRATNKAAMRRAFVQAGVPGPDFLHVHTGLAARDAARLLAGDIVVKPAHSSGGRGVTRVAAGAPAPPGQGVMVEACIEGPEYSVETITWRGQSIVVAITDKLTSGAPHFVELGHQQPTEADEPTRAAIRAVARRALQALGIDNAAGHVELRVGRDGPTLMECAARAGGGCISSHLVPLCTGVNMIGACIAIALGDTPDLRPSSQVSAAAIRFLTASPGRMVRIVGVDQARSTDGIVEIETYFGTGHEVGVLRDATARCGHVIATGSDVPAAARLAERVRDGILVVTQRH